MHRSPRKFKKSFLAAAALFTRVLYVCIQRGPDLSFTFCVCCCCCSSSSSSSSWGGHINQNTALLSNFTMLSAYCTIACSSARQPCPAALPGSPARQPCPAALPGSLARQPCPAALPGSLARQPCPAALQKSYKLLNNRPLHRPA
jgi:hypothetical protein